LSRKITSFGNSTEGIYFSPKPLNLSGMFLATTALFKLFKMKKILVLMGLSLMLFSFNFQNDTDGIIQALKSANALQVSEHFDAFIDLTLPAKDEIKNIGKNQAGIALRSFFEETGVKGFDLSSQREAGVTMYMAGKLQARSRSFNITVLLKNKDGKHQIISMRIN
jgi:hypothetical protein